MGIRLLSIPSCASGRVNESRKQDTRKQRHVHARGSGSVSTVKLAAVDGHAKATNAETWLFKRITICLDALVCRVLLKVDVCSKHDLLLREAARRVGEADDECLRVQHGQGISLLYIWPRKYDTFVGL